MAGLFGSQKIPEPTPPAALPDPADKQSLRKKRVGSRPSQQNKLTQSPGVLGREYSRGTLG